MKIRNTFIIFIVTGFWHGANWTFVVWGALNAIYLLPLLLTDRNKNNEIVAQGRLFPSFSELFHMLSTFGLFLSGLVFFRARNIEHAFQYFSEVFSLSLFSMPDYDNIGKSLITVSLVFILLSVEWLGRAHPHALYGIGTALPNKPVRWISYFVICLIVLLFSGQQQQFIYFQF